MLTKRATRFRMGVAYLRDLLGNEDVERQADGDRVMRGLKKKTRRLKL